MEQPTASTKKPIIITAIIVVVLLVVGVAGYFFLTGPRAPEPIDDHNRVADMTFQFDEITLSPGETADLDIYLQSDISVTSADISLVYNPEAIYVETMQPTINNFLGLPTEYEITENNIDNEEGLAIFRIQAFDTGEPPSTTRQGRGVIMRVRLTAHPTFAGQALVIIFKDEDVPNLTSKVSKENYDGSILDEAGSISILIE